MSTENSDPAGVVVQPLVLVVDDDPGVLDALSALLSPRLEPVYRLETAPSAEEALEVVGPSAEGSNLTPVALVISDEKMPGQSGTDLLVALRQHRAHRNGGRIIVTAYAGLASAKKAINEAEVDRYFPKPWDAEGSLLPAVGSVLARFAASERLDEYLLAGPATDPDQRQGVLDVRRAWWEYLTLFGESAEELGVEVPSFEKPEDEGATLFLARRLSPRGDGVAGTLRLRPTADGTAVQLDALAFQPEEAGDEVESLLLRAAVIDAAFRDVALVQTQAPTLRRELYEALGFVEMTDSRASAAAGAVSMQLRTSELKVPQAFLARYRADQRLCACAQDGCPARDYSRERRGYFCPLDLAEGRTPQGFPSQDGA